MAVRGFARARSGATSAVLALAALAACGDDDDDPTGPSVTGLPTFAQVQSALEAAVAENNGGLGFDMWATVVDRSGIVQVVAFSGDDAASQWPGSRVISAQKANTANAFSLTDFALSTGNLFAPTQPGGSLFGLQESNPVNEEAAYQGDAANFGTAEDPMLGERIGGINVFGGGLALYAADGTLLGALGVSGDTSCADHIIAWRVRAALNLDNVPGGVGAGNTDNIVHDIDANGNSAGGFGHPTCSAASTATANALPTTLPVGPNP